MENSTQASRKYELDCQCLHSCFSGNGILNKQKLVDLFTRRNAQELNLVRQTYGGLYNQDLLCALSAIRSNDIFVNALYLRMSEPHERDAEIVRDALFGIRVNLDILIEVVCTRSSLELHSVKQAYRAHYDSDMANDIAHKTTGSFKEILLAVTRSSGKFGGKVNISMAMCDAKTLFEAMESGNSIDWQTIMSLISERNSAQIKTILDSYKELYGHEFSKSLKSNKCGKFGKELRIAIGGIQFPEKFLAKRLRGALQNNDGREVVTRIIITRLDIDTKKISNLFAAKTGWSLQNFVRREFRDRNSHTDQTYKLVEDLLLGLLKYC